MWSPSNSPVPENPLDYLHDFDSEYSFELLMHTSEGFPPDSTYLGNPLLFEGSNFTDYRTHLEQGGIEVRNSFLAFPSPMSSVSTVSPASSDYSMERYLLSSCSPDFTSTVATCSPADTLLSVPDNNVDQEFRKLTLSAFSVPSSSALSQAPAYSSLSITTPSEKDVARKRKRADEDESLSYRDDTERRRAAKQRVSYKEFDSTDLDDDDDPEYEGYRDLKTGGPMQLDKKGPKGKSSSGWRSPSKIYPCPRRDCPKVFGRSYDAKRHDDTAHGNKKFICTNCNAILSRLDALVRHKALSKLCDKRSRQPREKRRAVDGKTRDG
ncbi:hypothetical protein J3R30DRAFT_3456534 [Lentinula aciculospora]|uniref:C2H2-type domain-containing protein n=1 Tax=Lentinula aciculospora TaxID=153920 RepID=A0A9W9AGI9_9AGAR|nr:hypothetical protein J3R30DRAFT_3456534 [Lentinula aciculospora]